MQKIAMWELCTPIILKNGNEQFYCHYNNSLCGNTAVRNFKTIQ